MGVLTFFIGRSYLVDQRERAAVRQSFVNARLVQSVLGRQNADLGDLLTSLRPDERSEVIVHDAEQWFATSLALDQEIVPPALEAIVSGGDAGWQRIEVDGGTALIVGVPMRGGAAEYYEVFPLVELRRTLRTLVTALALSAAIASLAGGIVGFLASRRILKPLRDVASVAGDIASGSLDRRLEVTDDADLGPLADAFNSMVTALGERIEREARFSSDVSHELRTPLAAMAAAVSIVDRRRESMPPALVEPFDLLRSQVDDFQELTLDLLEISRLDAGTVQLDLEPLDAATLATAIVDSLGDAGVQVHAPATAWVEGDKRRLRQVFANLVTNAERYGGGADQLAVEVDEDAGCVRFCVEDRGDGVPAHERDRIFGRFARGTSATIHPEVRGSGLGLSLAREHVLLHGGRIWVEDRPGGGARFVVELPTRPAPVTPQGDVA